MEIEKNKFFMEKEEQIEFLKEILGTPNLLISPLGRQIQEHKNNKEGPKEFHELIQKCSPSEQKFLFLSIMHRATKKFKEMDNDSELRIAFEGKLKLLEKGDNLKDEDFKQAVNLFTTAVVAFLEKEDDDLTEKQKKLLGELQIQKHEFKEANKGTRASLIAKGLSCLAFSVFAVWQITMKGAAVLSPIALAPLIISAAVLARERELSEVFANAMSWFKQLATHTQFKGMAGFLLLGAYQWDIKPSFSLQEPVKSAQQIFPAVQNTVLGVVSAALVPPAYFLSQFIQFRTNAHAMDELFKNGVIEEKLKEVQKPSL